MIKNYRLDQSFGPVGTVAGISLFAVGLIMIFFSLSGLIAIIIGTFVGFTYSSTLVDYDQKRLKFSNNIFGLIKIGKWIIIESNMKLGVKKSSKAWRAYSRSNRTIDLSGKDYRLILYDSMGKQIMPIKKTTTLEFAISEQKILAKELGLNML